MRRWIKVRFKYIRVHAGMELVFAEGINRWRLFVKAWALVLIIHCMSTAAVSSELSVLSFSDWKANKVQAAQAHYTRLENEYLAKKKQNSSDPQLVVMYKDLKNSKSNVSDLSDLNVTDYFIGYLSQFKSKKAAFQMAISKLGPTEMSELMEAYANSLLKTSGDGLSTAAGNSTEIPAK